MHVEGCCLPELAMQDDSPGGTESRRMRWTGVVRERTERWPEVRSRRAPNKVITYNSDTRRPRKHTASPTTEAQSSLLSQQPTKIKGTPPQTQGTCMCMQANPLSPGTQGRELQRIGITQAPPSVASGGWTTASPHPVLKTRKQKTKKVNW